MLCRRFSKFLNRKQVRTLTCLAFANGHATSQLALESVNLRSQTITRQFYSSQLLNAPDVKESNQFSLNEINLIDQQLDQSVKELLANKKLSAKYGPYVLEKLFESMVDLNNIDSNVITQKLIKHPDNWSHIRNRIKTLVTSASDRFEQFNIHSHMAEGIERIQRAKASELKHHQLAIALIESLVKDLNDDQTIQKVSGSGALTRVKVYEARASMMANLIEWMMNEKKKFLYQLELDDPLFKSYSNQLSASLRELNEEIKNIDFLPTGHATNLFRLYSYDKKLWQDSWKWLVAKSSMLARGLITSWQNFLHCMRGAMNHNEMEMFVEISRTFGEELSKQDITCFTAIQEDLRKLFIEFMVRSDKNTANLEYLLAVLSNLEIISETSLIRKMILFK